MPDLSFATTDIFTEVLVSDVLSCESTAPGASVSGLSTVSIFLHL